MLTKDLFIRYSDQSDATNDQVIILEKWMIEILKIVNLE